ncbi:hypothetical protein [uncultured Pontibacter sp.]|uniref:hypothetical protein n=1 Tax=uncultured Pontibacter sp. TaxID=453356 RepID=UPI00260E934F|nr:hypothetical protein [uncultured Pontibacter sp.]
MAYYLPKMLEYVKTILVKVSFDKMLFEKELRKAFKVLMREEIEQLKQWCYNQFSGVYLIILNRVFLKHQV